MIGDRTGTIYKLGDIVSVKLAEAAPLTGGMRFDLAESNSSQTRPQRPQQPRFKNHFEAQALIRW